MTCSLHKDAFKVAKHFGLLQAPGMLLRHCLIHFKLRNSWDLGWQLLLPDLPRIFLSGVLIGVISLIGEALGKPKAFSLQKLADPASVKGPDLSVGK